MVIKVIRIDDSYSFDHMISEGLCNAEDWSNDAKNSALHHKK